MKVKRPHNSYLPESWVRLKNDSKWSPEKFTLNINNLCFLMSEPNSCTISQKVRYSSSSLFWRGHDKSNHLKDPKSSAYMDTANPSSRRMSCSNLPEACCHSRNLTMSLGNTWSITHTISSNPLSINLVNNGALMHLERWGHACLVWELPSHMAAIKTLMSFFLW